MASKYFVHIEKDGTAYGPYALKAAKDFARIGSQHGSARAVTRGLDGPRVRLYAKGKRAWPTAARQLRGLTAGERPRALGVRNTAAFGTATEIGPLTGEQLMGAHVRGKFGRLWHAVEIIGWAIDDTKPAGQQVVFGARKLDGRGRRTREKFWGYLSRDGKHVLALFREAASTRRLPRDASPSKLPVWLLAGPRADVLQVVSRREAGLPFVVLAPRGSVELSAAEKRRLANGEAVKRTVDGAWFEDLVTEALVDEAIAMTPNRGGLQQVLVMAGTRRGRLVLVPKGDDPDDPEVWAEVSLGALPLKQREKVTIARGGAVMGVVDGEWFDEQVELTLARAGIGEGWN